MAATADNASLTIVIEWDGKTYTYDPSKVTVQQAIAITDYTGMGMRSWEKAIDDAQPKALQALLYAIKAQNGERAAIQTLNFSISDFYEVVTRAIREAVADRIASLKLDDENADPTETAES